MYVIAVSPVAQFNLDINLNPTYLHRSSSASTHGGSAHHHANHRLSRQCDTHVHPLPVSDKRNISMHMCWVALRVRDVLGL
jgi:hypothetical protein